MLRGIERCALSAGSRACWVLLAAVVLFSSAPGHGAFNSYGPDGLLDGRYVGVKIGPPDQKVRDEGLDIMALRATKGEKNYSQLDAQEQQKIADRYDAARASVEAAVNLVGGAAIYLWSGRKAFDLDIGSKLVAGACQPDYMQAMADDAINIKEWAFDFTLTPSASSPETLSLGFTVHHETLHAQQWWPECGKKQPWSLPLAVGQYLETVKHEQAASQGGLEVVQSVRTGRANLANGQPHGQTGFAGNYLDAYWKDYKDATPEQKAKMDKDLDLTLKLEEFDQKVHKKCHADAQKLLEDYKNNNINEQQLREGLGKLLIPINLDTRPGGGQPKPFVRITPDSPTLWQQDPDTGQTHETFDLGIPTPIDVQYTDDGIMVSGLNAGGHGVIAHYTDSDGDGWYDAGNVTWYATDAANITAGPTLAYNPVDGQWYVFNSLDGRIYSLADLANAVNPANIADLMDARTIQFLEDGSIVTSMSLFGSHEGAGRYSPVVTLSDLDENGFWESWVTQTWQQYIEIEPRFHDDFLIAGDVMILVTGDEDNPVAIYLTDALGGNRIEIGRGILGDDFSTAVGLYPGITLQEGQYIVIRDEYLGMETGVMMVVPEPAVTLLLAVGLPILLARRSPRACSTPARGR